MNIIYRQIREEDKDTINDLYEKLLDDHSASVGMGHRIWILDFIKIWDFLYIKGKMSTHISFVKNWAKMWR